MLQFRLVPIFEAEVDALGPEIRVSQKDRGASGRGCRIEPDISRDLRAAQSEVDLVPRSNDRAPIQERVTD